MLEEIIDRDTEIPIATEASKIQEKKSVQMVKEPLLNLIQEIKQL